MRVASTKARTIRIDADLLDAIQVTAEKEDRSVNYVLNRLLRERLAAQGAVSPKRAKVRQLAE